MYAYAAIANNGTSKRSAALTLTRTGMAASTKRVTVSQNYFPPLRGGNSNCYMVKPGNAVEIPVDRANESFVELIGSDYNPITKTYYQLLSDTQWTASLVWEDSVGLVSLSENMGTGPSGHFKVTTEHLHSQGNAVVAIKNASDEILWSWHIWVTNYDGSSTFTTNNGKRDIIFMDRDLGATSAQANDLNSCGLLYQWGRKDPFPGIGQEGGSWTKNDGKDFIRVYNALGSAYEIAKTTVPNVTPNNLTNAIRRPDTFYYDPTSPSDWFTKVKLNRNSNLWSGEDKASSTHTLKSVFDPCPTGWRVVLWLDKVSPFAGMGSGFTAGNHGLTWNGKNETIGYFLLSGRRNSDSGLLYNVNFIGYCWTGSAIDVDRSHDFDFWAEAANTTMSTSRACGLPVRCCRDNL